MSGQRGRFQKGMDGRSKEEGRLIKPTFKGESPGGKADARGLCVLQSKDRLRLAPAMETLDD